MLVAPGHPGCIAMIGHEPSGEAGPVSGTARTRRSWQRLASGVIVACAAWVSLRGEEPIARTDTLDPLEPPPAREVTEADSVRPPLNRKAILIKSVPPEYPAEFVGSGMNAQVVVTMLVDRKGRASHIRVQGSPDAAFTEAALAALAQFEFLPAIRNGRLTNAEVQLTLELREELGDRTLVDYEGGRIELLATSNAVRVDTPIRRLFAPRPAYPIESLAAGKSGEVIIEFVVGDDGVPREPRVVETTHLAFSQAVEGAIGLWRYSPALNGTRPVPTGLRYRVSFEAGDFSEAMRAIAKRLLAGDTSDVVGARLLDRQPRARSRIAPAAPPGRPGETVAAHRAEVVFMVDAKGAVRFPRVLKASDPIAGYAALAAVGYWTFEPAMHKKEPVPVLVTMPLSF